MVVRATGSTPQKSGAKAIFEPAGAIWGTLGGGCLEAESRKRALDALDGGASLLFDLSLDHDYGWDDGLICGGDVRVFVTARTAEFRTALEQAVEAAENRARGALVTRLPRQADETATVRWITHEDIAAHADFPGAEAVQTCIETGFAKHFYSEDESAEVFVEPVAPLPRLLIAGGGHVGQATAQLGVFLGFDVTVVDDRPAYTRADRYPEGTQTICGEIAAECARFPVGLDTYIVIVTRGHRHDEDVLREVVKSDAAYIGMIGSRRKAILVKKRLVAEGIASEQEINRVFSPVGLDIGALSVEEIATSIVAQLIEARRRGVGRIPHIAELK